MCLVFCTRNYPAAEPLCKMANLLIALIPRESIFVAIGREQREGGWGSKPFLTAFENCSVGCFSVAEIYCVTLRRTGSASSWLGRSNETDFY